MRQSVIILISTIMLFLGACRTNNGDIGPLYGEWALRSMVVDGEPADINCEKFFFRFQNNIVMITETADFYDFYNSFGTWELSAGRLVLNFSHTTSHSNMANLPADLLFPERGILDFEVNNLTTKYLTLTYDNPEGKHIVYAFEKLQ